jgi:hypothetical protein
VARQNSNCDCCSARVVIVRLTHDAMEMPRGHSSHTHTHTHYTNKLADTHSTMDARFLPRGITTCQPTYMFPHRGTPAARATQPRHQSPVSTLPHRHGSPRPPLFEPTSFGHLSPQSASQQSIRRRNGAVQQCARALASPCRRGSPWILFTQQATMTYHQTTA